MNAINQGKNLGTDVNGYCLLGIAGIFVGGCVERGVGSSFRASAHAHNHTNDKDYGWICIRSQKRVLTPSGQPSTLLLHEYAHILTPNQGHTAKWRECLTKLGRPAEAQRYVARYTKARA